MTPNGEPRCHADEIANARAHFADLRDGGNLPRKRPGLIRGIILTPFAVVAIWAAIYGVMTL